MPHPDRTPHPADDPSASDPEAIYRAYLTTDARPAIHAATTEQLRGILAAIARNLCHHLAEPTGGVPPLGPDLRRPWQVCQVGTGTRAGLQLYRHVEQAVAAATCTPSASTLTVPPSETPTTPPSLTRSCEQPVRRR